MDPYLMNAFTYTCDNIINEIVDSVDVTVRRRNNQQQVNMEPQENSDQLGVVEQGGNVVRIAGHEQQENTEQADTGHISNNAADALVVESGDQIAISPKSNDSQTIGANSSKVRLHNETTGRNQDLSEGESQSETKTTSSTLTVSTETISEHRSPEVTENSLNVEGNEVIAKSFKAQENDTEIKENNQEKQSSATRRENATENKESNEENLESGTEKDIAPENKENDEANLESVIESKEGETEDTDDNIEAGDSGRACVFDIGGGGANLQDAFKRFKNSKQQEIKKGRKHKRSELNDEARIRALADPARMERLRAKFLDQCKKYFGVPYAKKYWTENDPEYKSKLFLDCCGLTRRALRDLKKDFGFRIGPWNQAYQFDTLPITIENEKDVKPGDLVFISAIYNSPKKKKQRHNMVHVEVMLGDGPKTIGARWNNGKVQVFDHYKFNSTSYHSQQYIFKSLDTWLMGICRSHCKQHKWKTTAERFTPTKKSIFSLDPDNKSDIQNEEPDQGASDSDGEGEATPRVGDVTARDEATPRPRGGRKQKVNDGVIVIDCTEDDDDDDDDTSFGVYNKLSRNQLDNLVARQLERTPAKTRVGADGFMDLGEISSAREVDSNVSTIDVDDAMDNVSSMTSLDSMVSLDDTSSMASSSRGSQTTGVAVPLDERDRLKVTCYASVAKGDASVQINTPENFVVEIDDDQFSEATEDGNVNNSNNDKYSDSYHGNHDASKRFIPEAIRVYRQTYSTPSPTSDLTDDNDLGTV